MPYEEGMDDYALYVDLWGAISPWGIIPGVVFGVIGEFFVIVAAL